MAAVAILFYRAYIEELSVLQVIIVLCIGSGATEHKQAYRKQEFKTRWHKQYLLSYE
jgi:hypothetical protein